MGAVRIDHPEFKDNPYSTYDRWRNEKPVCRVKLPIVGEGYVLACYDDVVALLKDTRFTKDRSAVLRSGEAAQEPAITRPFLAVTNSMLDKDGSQHARLRRLVDGVFTWQRIELMTARIAALSETLLDGLSGREEIDLIADFALPLPATVISDLLGVPERDRARFVRWSKALITISQSSRAMSLGVERLESFLGYVEGLIQQRVKEPSEDLVSALVLARDEADLLSSDELVSMVVLLVFAGHETTTNLIGNGVVALLRSPDQLLKLRENPRLMEPAVEELLRFAPPVETSTFRYARTDLDIAGTSIKRGDAVLGLVNSANRDEAVFCDAGRLDIERSPNRHLTFGSGEHHCLGASLARLEARTAIGALLRRYGELRMSRSDERLPWRTSVTLRGLERLPLRVSM